MYTDWQIFRQESRATVSVASLRTVCVLILEPVFILLSKNIINTNDVDYIMEQSIKISTSSCFTLCFFILVFRVFSDLLQIESFQIMQVADWITILLPRDASAERGYEILCRPSVCPSVCLWRSGTVFK